MNVTGARTIRAPAAAIWEFLLTPNRLRLCLPGCEHFDASGPDAFTARLRLGVGFWKGSYSGTVKVTERQPHNVLGLAVEGKGALGSLVASGTVHFTEIGEATQLTYDGEARVGGRIAALGERVVSTAANKLIGVFFDCVSSHVLR